MFASEAVLLPHIGGKRTISTRQGRYRLTLPFEHLQWGLYQRKGFALEPVDKLYVISPEQVRKLYRVEIVRLAGKDSAVPWRGNKAMRIYFAPPEPAYRLVYAACLGNILVYVGEYWKDPVVANTLEELIQALRKGYEGDRFIAKALEGRLEEERKKSFEQQVRDALPSSVEAIRITSRPGNRYEVEYVWQGRSYRAVVDEKLTLIEVGICLDGNDSHYTLHVHPYLVRHEIESAYDDY